MTDPKDPKLKADLPLDKDWEGNPLDWRENLGEEPELTGAEAMELFNSDRKATLKMAADINKKPAVKKNKDFGDSLELVFNSAKGQLVVKPGSGTLSQDAMIKLMMHIGGFGYTCYSAGPDAKILVDSLSEIETIIGLCSSYLKRKEYVASEKIMFEMIEGGIAGAPQGDIVAKWELKDPKNKYTKASVSEQFEDDIRVNKNEPNPYPDLIGGGDRGTSWQMGEYGSVIDLKKIGGNQIAVTIKPQAGTFVQGTDTEAAQLSADLQKFLHGQFSSIHPIDQEKDKTSTFVIEFSQHEPSNEVATRLVNLIKGFSKAQGMLYSWIQKPMEKLKGLFGQIELRKDYTAKKPEMTSEARLRALIKLAEMNEEAEESCDSELLERHNRLKGTSSSGAGDSQSSGAGDRLR